ncbi:3-deoxy-7-phosphoheptulonate synthase [Streptomyces sp.]|uniref:3-deoxy-7-phosphoheptulonate synthase n=1 Tax=Streptomyces sp. TaxID=1931 RepID=UPI002F41BBED
MEEALRDIVRSRPAVQQPEWGDPHEMAKVRAELAACPPLTTVRDVRRLSGLLATVAMGGAQVVQCGDCAEDPAECTPGYVARKAELLDMAARTIRRTSGLPVVRAGRIAGQFGKPRSRPTERVGGRELPVYRGHMVNSPEPDPHLRRPDPGRLLACHSAARSAMAHLGWLDSGCPPVAVPEVWTSHEALLLDYEEPMVRPDGEGGLLLTSTHWPWIGERTRHVEGAHVALLSQVSNPVGCKVGPSMTPAELTELCGRLDPRREPGRLTLIARMGADTVTERLPALVRAVRAAGHPVIWLTDPMHGNTVQTPDGFKTRFVTTVVREVEGFLRAVEEAGGTPGGLHLETTPDRVTECVQDASEIGRVSDKYTSFCDPRLNVRQLMDVLQAWRAA